MADHPETTGPKMLVATLPIRNGLAWVWLVWALRPGEATLVALCTSEQIAEGYRSSAAEVHPGAVLHVEEAPVDHICGGADVRSIAWRAASRAVRRRQELVAHRPHGKGTVDASHGR